MTIYFRNMRSIEKHNKNKLEIENFFDNIRKENFQMKTLYIFLLRNF